MHQTFTTFFFDPCEYPVKMALENNSCLTLDNFLYRLTADILRRKEC